MDRGFIRFAPPVDAELLRNPFSSSARRCPEAVSDEAIQKAGLRDKGYCGWHLHKQAPATLRRAYPHSLDRGPLSPALRTSARQAAAASAAGLAG